MLAPSRTTDLATVLHRWRAAFGAAARMTAPLWLLLLAYFAYAAAVAWKLRLPLGEYLAGNGYILLAFALIGICLGFLVLLGKMAFVHREPRPARGIVRELRALFTPEHAALAILLLLAVAALQDIYNFLKPQIPRLVPYSWDPVFAAADRLIFLGWQPWQLIWPLFGTPMATWLLGLAYNLWFFWMVLVWVLVAFATTHTHERLQYFLSVVIAWTLGGTAMATIFSSVGPCYYGNFGFGGDPFTEQMKDLFAMNRALPVYSLTVQDLLWHGQMDPSPGILAGISAFPSMHVTSAVLRTRIAFVYSRTLGVLSLLATLVIFVASIHLAWHYAVDGIAGAAIALSAWWVAGKILHAWSRRHPLADRRPAETVTV